MRQIHSLVHHIIYELNDNSKYFSDTTVCAHTINRKNLTKEKMLILVFCK